MSDTVDDADNVVGADHAVEPAQPEGAADMAAGAAAEVTAERDAEFEPTGEDAVDQVLANLGSLDGLTPEEQVSPYDEAHRRLHDILTGADELDDLALGSHDDNGG